MSHFLQDEVAKNAEFGLAQDKNAGFFPKTLPKWKFGLHFRVTVFVMFIHSAIRYHTRNRPGNTAGSGRIPGGTGYVGDQDRCRS